jgi:nucleoside-diphosphate-sugar epimerase
MYIPLPPPQNETELDDRLTAPDDAVIDAVTRLDGDLLILGAGGKMGPTQALLAQRSLRAAGLPWRVRCVSRFSAPEAARALSEAGIDVISADLLAPGALESLPDAPNVLYLVGMKFGATGAEPLTWMLNTFLPGLVARRYQASRIVALSTGNVYPLTPVVGGGASESTPVGPIGDYAQSCVGRERMFQHAALAYGTRVALLRLYYANDLRYGVLRDVAERVRNGQPIDLAMGNASLIWQGDANRVHLQAFSICAAPARILNVTGPETVSFRWLAERFGQLFGVAPIFTGTESGHALFANAVECQRLFGYPRVTLGEMIEWTAHWVKIGGRSLAKPTHFETRDGKY